MTNTTTYQISLAVGSLDDDPPAEVWRRFGSEVCDLIVKHGGHIHCTYDAYMPDEPFPTALVINFTVQSVSGIKAELLGICLKYGHSPIEVLRYAEGQVTAA